MTSTNLAPSGKGIFKRVIVLPAGTFNNAM